MNDTLQFLRELPLYESEQPYELYGFPDKDSKKYTNCEFESNFVTVEDVRRMGEAPQLYKHGFMFLRHASSCPLEATHFETVGGDKTVLTTYLEETISLVQSELGAEKVVCFDWRFRRYNPKAEDRIPARATKDVRNFALPTGDIVHCDYSAQGGKDRIRLHLSPEELQAASKAGLVPMIVNVWRPLNKVVRNTPLLLCDRRSVRKSDLIEVDKVLPDKVEKSYFLFHRNDHRWYTLRNQRSDEVAVFITWCSTTGDDAIAAYSPHGAGGIQEDDWADPRESVEVRLIVLLDAAKSK